METYRTSAGHEWDKARRKAFWGKLLTLLTSAENELLSFEDISSRLNLKNSVYRGRINVHLESIVGSVGRYHDFTRQFFPKANISEDRWKSVAAAYLNPTSGGVPPIELFKIANAYFVRDGNHRVSVARQLGFHDIEAYVWEYLLPDPNIDLSNIDAVMTEAERQDFLQATQLDVLRPQHHIVVNQPGGYRELLYQITHYQRVLDEIDQLDTPYADAVTAWYDMIYETVIQKIRAEGVMEMFPNRSEADFFVWIMRYHRQLKAEHKQPIMLSQVMRQFREKHQSGRWGQLRLRLMRLLGRKSGDGVDID